MQFVATLRINGALHEIKSKDMPEWIARKQIYTLCKELRSQGKQVKLVSFVEASDELEKHIN